jgi:hypothetical protein
VPRPCRGLCDRAGVLTSYVSERNSHALPLASGPVRLDLDCTFGSGEVVPETAPGPILRVLHQSSSDRVAMNIAQLLGLFGVAPYVEIVIARLPEWAALRATKALGYVLLQHLQCHGKFGSLRLGQQQMNVLRHDHISGNVKAIPLACIFEGFFEDIAGVRGAQSGRAGIATEGNEMKAACFLVSL